MLASGSRGDWSGCSSASFERRADGPGKSLPVKLVPPRQRPDIVKVLPRTVGAAEQHHRLEVFGDPRFRRIGPQPWRRKIEQNRYIQLNRAMLGKDRRHHLIEEEERTKSVLGAPVV